MVFYFWSDVLGKPEYYIYVGEDKFENDRLITELSSPCDVWFHVEDLSSAHVYLRLHEPEASAIRTATKKIEDFIPKKLMDECCQLCKANSITGNKQPVVDIVLTVASNLKKTPAMSPGEVGFHDDRLVSHVKDVAKDNAIVKRLEKTRQQRSGDELIKYKEDYFKAQREADKERKRKEKEEQEARRVEKEARNYDTLFKPENMQSNRQTSNMADDDFM